MRAPNLGTFYRAPKPGAPPYVSVGQRVEPTTELCLIEVMKLFTSVAAGVTGIGAAGAGGGRANWSNSTRRCFSSNPTPESPAMPLRRVLVANRGEIALRIVRAARSLGIETVLAASAADRDSLAAREADRVVTLGPAPARCSYLDPRLVVHAAKATGCDALHPGYGFLSERAALARLCEEHGITFVGPTRRHDRGGRRQARRRAASPKRPACR